MTLEQAKLLNLGAELHWHWNNERGCEKWRINGKVKLWKRDSSRILVPIKHGLYNYGYLHEGNLHLFHLAADCNLEKETK